MSEDQLDKRYKAFLVEEEERWSLGPTDIAIGRLRINAARNEVLVDDVEIVLTGMQFRLLHLLAIHDRRVLSIETIIDRLASDSEASVRSVICRLRSKLGTAQTQLRTHVGLGYSLRG